MTHLEPMDLSIRPMRAVGRRNFEFGVAEGTGRV